MLCNLSDYEVMLHRIFAEKQAVAAAEQRIQDEEVAEEHNAREGLKDVFEKR
jgi:hypothetical protein